MSFGKRESHCDLRNNKNNTLQNEQNCNMQNEKNCSLQNDLDWVISFHIDLQNRLRQSYHK